jgi:hypothetical protein
MNGGAEQWRSAVFRLPDPDESRSRSHGEIIEWAGRTARTLLAASGRHWKLSSGRGIFIFGGQREGKLSWPTACLTLLKLPLN